MGGIFSVMLCFSLHQKFIMIKYFSKTRPLSPCGMYLKTLYTNQGDVPRCLD